MTEYKPFGKKGKGSAPPPPIEEADSLRSDSQATLVDLLCEGQIYGPANDDNWYKSTYFNETPVMQSDGTLNFQGVELTGRLGSADQEYLRGFDDVRTENAVGVTVEKGNPVARSIDADVDDVKITLTFPILMVQTSTGDLLRTTVNYRITVQATGGNEIVVVNGSVYGKTTSSYQKQHTLKELTTWGNGPWTIRVYRDTNDSSSAKLQNSFQWTSYSEITNVKLRYMHRSVIGINLNAKDYGGEIPYRAYKIKGKADIKYPDNYDPDSRTYSGPWTGNFSTGYTNNPAWCVYDMLTKERYGVGLPESAVDKYALYTIAQYCDELVTFKVKTRNAIGGYDETEVQEPRFTMNGVIQSRQEALAVINHMCSVFRGFAIWNTGAVSFVQDSPKVVTKIATPANVIDGSFEYESSPRSMRHTAAKVMYNDPDKFSKLSPIILEDEEGIRRYGYQPLEITCFMCNSRNEALRRAKHILYSDINQTELVKFTAGWDFATTLPGDLVAVQDPYHSSEFFSGRVKASTTNHIVIDRDIEIESGVTYTLYVQTSTGVEERTLTNAAGTWNVLTWTTALSEVVETDNVWALSSSNVALRKFMVTRVGEVEKGKYEINGIEYNPNKFAEVEEGLVIEAPPTTGFDEQLEPPSSIDIQPYSYTEGDSNNRKYGMNISWVASPDPRTDDYQIRYKFGDQTGWNALGSTGQLSYDWKDVADGLYDISVRARGTIGTSVWVTYPDFTLNAYVSGAEPPTNLQVLGGGTQFSGPDCEIEWDASDGTSYADGFVPSASVGPSNVKGYKVEVYKVDDTLLRTEFTKSREDETYNYTLQKNREDNSGSPIRQIKFKVYTIDLYDDLSATSAVLVASNPAPDMSSSTPTVTSKFGHLKVEWTLVNDNDMLKYNIYSTTTPGATPDQLVAVVNHPQTIWNYMDVTTANTYRIIIEPYDEFGVGIASQVDSATPLTIPAIDVESELQQSVIITDSDGHDLATCYRLYDREYDTGGIQYTLRTTDKWIQYEYGVKNYIDRVAIWTADANAKVYIAYSLDGIDWDYLKADTNHSLSDSTLNYAINQQDGKNNYWQLAEGKNVANFPNNIVATHVKIWMVGGNYSTRIYEAIPSRLIVSELAAIEFLSSMSADIGTIIAGNIQSGDYSASTGFNIDMDSKQIFMGGSDNPTLYFDSNTGTLNIDAVVTFKNGSNGYDQIADAPELDYLDAWRHPSDETKIDGGSVFIGSNLFLSEGGRAVFGNSNVIIDTENTEGDNPSHGRIIVSEDGGPLTNSYCELNDGDISFFYWDGERHQPYKSLNVAVVGVGENNVETVIKNSDGTPALFKEQPRIMISPLQIQTYNQPANAQSQSIDFRVVNLREYAQYKWKFTPRAQLAYTAGSASFPVTDQDINYEEWNTNSLRRTPVPTTLQTPTKVLAPNVRRLYVTTRTTSWYAYEYTYTIYNSGKSDLSDKTTETRSRLRYGRYYLYFYYYLEGLGWRSVVKYVDPGRLTFPTAAYELKWDTEVKSADITQYYFKQVHESYDLTYRRIVAGRYGSKTRQSIDVVDYTTDIAASDALVDGTLNYIAIGS